ncbi:MAG: MFS transporter, partial [Chitinophagaceae bacterium]|nr:MFS transporter [Chitinophagaceae bacterium]
LISVFIQKKYHNKYVTSPEGEILGLTPGTPASQPGKAISPVAAPPKFWLNPFFIITGMLVFGGVMIGAMFLDSQYNYLSYLLLACTLVIAILIFSDKTLTREERQRVIVMFIIAFFVVFFWAAYEQTGASLSLFANEQTNLNLWGSYHMPPSYFQSFNSVFIIIFAPIFAWFWLKLGKKQPATPSKMGIGLILLSLGYLWIAFGVSGVTPGVKVSIIWLTGMYLLHTWGELCLSPIGLSLFNKLSPLKFASLLMAVWFLGNAGGNKLAGVLSSLYPENGRITSFLGYQMTSLYDFFMLFVIMAGTAGVVLLLLSKRLQKMMHGIS